MSTHNTHTRQTSMPPAEIRLKKKKKKKKKKTI
jgi:hypothetical protein